MPIKLEIITWGIATLSTRLEITAEITEFIVSKNEEIVSFLFENCEEISSESPACHQTGLDSFRALSFSRVQILIHFVLYL